jgi:hypothetical protein
MSALLAKIGTAIAGAIAPYLIHMAIGGGLVLAAVAGFVGVKTHYTNVGYNQAMEAVAAQDQEAINAAASARERVRSCRDTGGVWDVTEGVCRRQ